jgi:chromosome segregation ATPase
MTDVTATMQKERDRLMKRLREQSQKVSATADARLEKEDPHGLLARYATRLQQVTDEKEAAIERYDAQIRDYAERISNLETKLTEIREEAAAKEGAVAAQPKKGRRKTAKKASPKRATPKE